MSVIAVAKGRYINLISFVKFKLASNFSRSKSDHGGSCIFVKHCVQSKEINYLISDTKSASKK
jgi:hypothetical protein